MINFTETQLAAFKDSREADLAKWNWNRLKALFPDRAEEIIGSGQKGIKFMRQAHNNARKYLPNLEESQHYNKWRLVYGTLAFVAGSVDFDQNPWNSSILTEPLLHPFQRLDLLVGVAEICIDNKENVLFFDRLMELVL